MKKLSTKGKRFLGDQTVIATVDLGKSMNWGYMRGPDGRDIKPFGFSNDGHGFNEFLSRIFKFMKSHSLKDVVVGFESTGPYGEPLSHYLEKQGIRLVQVNPMHTKRIKELQGNSPEKSDKKDPKVIADVIELGHALSVIIPKGASAELRRLSWARERAVARRTVLLNQLHELIFILFPEFLTVMKDMKGKTSRYLLSNHPTPQDVLELGIKPLKSIMKTISRGKLGEERAQALYEAALDSVGLSEGRWAIIFEVESLLSLIDATDQIIDDLEQKMSEYLEGISQAKFILSLKGIGKVTAAGIIGEVGDFSKFSTASEVLKLAGLDLYEISSGNYKGSRRISKRGRPLMRKLLFFATLNMVRKGAIFNADYQRHLEKGMPKMKALIAITRKLLRLIFALVRDQSFYVSDYPGRQVPVLSDAA